MLCNAISYIPSINTNIVNTNIGQKMFKLIETAIHYFLVSQNEMDSYIKSHHPTTISQVEDLMRQYPSSAGLYQ